MFALAILRVFLYPETSLYRRALRWPVLAWFGLISYALYMYHQSINGMVHAFLFDQEPKITDWRHWIAAAFIMLISIGLAKLSYDWFETPIRRLGRRVGYQTAGAPVPRGAGAGAAI